MLFYFESVAIDVEPSSGWVALTARCKTFNLSHLSTK